MRCRHRSLSLSLSVCVCVCVCVCVYVYVCVCVCVRAAYGCRGTRANNSHHDPLETTTLGEEQRESDAPVRRHFALNKLQRTQVRELPRDGAGGVYLTLLVIEPSAFDSDGTDCLL